MPVTRGRARLMGSQEEDVEDEPSQQMQQTPEEQDEHMSTEADAPGVDLKEMAKQLTKTLKHLLTTHRQLENEAATIQAGIDELHRMQEARAERIAERLKNASSTILTFGEAGQSAHSGDLENEANDNEDEAMN